jgi:hypothetical protein
MSAGTVVCGSLVGSIGRSGRSCLPRDGVLRFQCLSLFRSFPLSSFLSLFPVVVSVVVLSLFLSFAYSPCVVLGFCRSVVVSVVASLLVSFLASLVASLVVVVVITVPSNVD